MSDLLTDEEFERNMERIGVACWNVEQRTGYDYHTCRDRIIADRAALKAEVERLESGGNINQFIFDWFNERYPDEMAVALAEWEKVRDEAP